MTQIQFNLMNFPFAEQLTALFDRYSDDYEYTSEGIFRLFTPLQCPECGTLMDHNGLNSRTKRWLGIVKIGKYSCPECQNNVTELCDFWEDAKKEFFGIFANFYQLLKVNHVSYEVLEKASGYFYPCDKDTIRARISAATDKMEIPEIKYIRIVHYDEQHPKAGRSQMYRLTIFDYLSKQIIADELFDSKDMKTVEDFLRRNLDTNKPIFIVTDLSLGYRKLFKKIFKNMVTHQLCLLHLNKLIVSDFSINTTIAEELIKYRLFYRNTPMLASGIKSMRIQLGKGSDRYSIIFMRRRLACPACLQRGAPPPFDFARLQCELIGHCYLLRLAHPFILVPPLALMFW